MYIILIIILLRVKVRVFNATFNNISVISWQSVLLVEEIGVPKENHWPVASNWQTLSCNVVSSTLHHEQVFKFTTLVVIDTDCIVSCISNYHTITTDVVSRISIRARCTTLCDKVCQWLATGRWFSPGTLFSSTKKTHDVVSGAPCHERGSKSQI